ncbi:MAG: M1 family aminopeptidase [Bacteroidia bacterium]|nr:M1 family aminopeptidase [Bacteroidia bacterium]MDW8235559.1 M1 family aminopeptidase [Bacteroidia bacterium]
MATTLILFWLQTAFHTDPFQPLEDFAPPPPPSRTVLGTPSPTYWQNRADYQMEIEIDPATHRLRGSARLTYTHHGPFPLMYLWLAVEPNYFGLKGYGHLSRNFLWENFQRDVRRGEIPRIELYARQLANYQKTNFTLEEVALEEGVSVSPLPYRIEETLMEVTLPRLLGTGERITLRLRWSFTLNDALVEGRGGYMLTDKGPIYQVAQYYPRPVLLNDIRGWEKMPYYGPSEFATEFGDYEVSVRMPSGYIVAATGRLLNPESVLPENIRERLQRVSSETNSFIISEKDLPLKGGKGVQTWRFRAENVRDFAFAASPNYLWEARLTQVPGAPQPTLVQAFYTPEIAPLWKHLAVAAAEHALHEYSRYTLPFPYPSMSITYGGVYGMEYPMIVFCGRQRLEKDGSYTQATRWAFISLVIHEVGHNFFPMVINSDERRWMWLDEGLNTYLENLSKETFEPLIRDEEKIAEYQRVRSYLANRRSQPILGHPHTIREMGANAYLKTAIGLELLRNYVLDPARWDTAFQRYARTWAFRHPEPWDFFRMLSSSIGQELGWFWKGWFLDTLPVDIAIDTAIQVKVGPESRTREILLSEETHAVERYLQVLAKDTQSLRFLTDKRREIRDKYVDSSYIRYQQKLALSKKQFQETAQVCQSYLRREDKEGIYEVRVLFRNVGGLVWPLWVKLTYEGGASSLWYFPAEAWAKEPRLFLRVFYTRQPVVKIEIDPFGWSPDIQPANHAYSLAGRG